MFVLDVSRSMLADDAAPNRLERAKQQIKDTVDEMAGDRVGLVVFAGDVKQQIPLTTHYDDFKQRLDEVGPHNVRRGGSRLGDAIEAASHAFLTKSNAHKAMVIFTDGEDQESEPVAAAKKAHEETGVRIFTVGLGDMEKGSRIPVGVERAHGLLANMMASRYGRSSTAKCCGKWPPRPTGRTCRPAPSKSTWPTCTTATSPASSRRNSRRRQINQYEARFQWFLLPALVLLLGRDRDHDLAGPGCCGASRAAAAAHQKAQTARTSHPLIRQSLQQFDRSMNAILNEQSVPVSCSPVSASGGPLWAGDVDREFAVGVNAANAKLRGGDVDGALAAVSDDRTLAPESADLSYNMAVAQYRKGDIAAAEQLFRRRRRARTIRWPARPATTWATAITPAD